jgi:P4 family phage/plasmid primase-like protien
VNDNIADCGAGTHSKRNTRTPWPTRRRAAGDSEPHQSQRGPVDRQTVAAALYAMDRSFVDDDKSWLDVGQALWSWDPSETTLGLWTSRSTRDGVRTAEHCRTAWKQFGDRSREGSVTIEHLFNLASQCGWQPAANAAARNGAPGSGAWALAQELLNIAYLRQEGEAAVLALRYYRGEFFIWSNGRYAKRAPEEIRATVVRFLGERAVNVTMMLTSAVVDCIRAMTEVPADLEGPFWLDVEAEELNGELEPPLPPEDLIAAKNGLINVPAFLAGRDCLLPPTARFFCTNAVDFDFEPKGKEPKRWRAFLDELWPTDQSSIDAFQEWAGYLVMRRTELQKILMIVGPPRSGKGTIAKVLSELVGRASAVSPKLVDFSLNFGLAPLLDKALAIIPDARLGSRHDEATLVERLLSISGEDTITIDRKHRDPLTVKLQARVTILTNELPSWADTAGALASRLIVLRLSRSFVSPDGSVRDKGQNDAAGLGDPQLWPKLQRELPGILRWALRGWKRLQERGYFLQPESGRPLLEQAADLASPIHAFVADECVTGAGKQVLAQELFDCWKRYCERTGEESGSIQAFAKGLRAVVPDLETRREKHNGHTDRWLVGLSPSRPSFNRAQRHLAPVSQKEAESAREEGLQPVQRREQNMSSGPALDGHPLRAPGPRNPAKKSLGARDRRSMTFSPINREKPSETREK